MAYNYMDFKVDLNHINKTIENLNKFSEQYTRCIDDGLDEVAIKTKAKAREYLASHPSKKSGSLIASDVANKLEVEEIGWGTERVIRVSSSSDHADFVEFGTGIVGQENPHPNPDGWEYDVNGHGEAGWIYIDKLENKKRWTAGMEARPYIYPTYLWLKTGQATRILRRRLRGAFRK